MNNLYQNIIHRSEMVLGTPAMERLSVARVIIFGVGGVGSWCAESLVRTGIKKITIVDSDIICPTNINRQIQATSFNIGKSKVEELAVRLRSINPEAEITAVHAAYDEASFSGFNLPSYDFVIDAIDSLKNKVLLLEQCVAGGVTVYSSMGAGARNDPSRIKIDLIANTKNCPLARRVRKMLRDRNVIADILCVYSDELPVDPAVETLCGTGDCACVYDRDNFCEENESGAVDWCSMKRQVNGALVHITAIFGFMLAGLVVNNIAHRKK